MPTYNRKRFNFYQKPHKEEPKEEEIIMNELMNSNNWNEISSIYLLSEKFIEKWSHKLNWKLISSYQKLSEKFIEKHINELDKYAIINSQEMSYNFIRKMNLDYYYYQRQREVEYEMRFKMDYFGDWEEI